jgi:hypothetical protein
MTIPSARSPFAAKSIVLPGLVMILASASFAQSWPVSYMTIPASVPLTTTKTTTTTTPIAVAGTTLPGYGLVNVAWSPATAYSHQIEPFSPNGVAGPFAWGATADVLNMFANNGAEKYTVTFTFLNGPPGPEKAATGGRGLGFRHDGHCDPGRCCFEHGGVWTALRVSIYICRLQDGLWL